MWIRATLFMVLVPSIMVCMMYEKIIYPPVYLLADVKDITLL